MVVDYLGLFGSRFGPDETDTPLVVDTDAVLAFTVVGECFESVAWRRSQVEKGRRAIELDKLAARSSLKFRAPSRYVLSIPDPFGFFVPERTDHPYIVAERAISGKRYAGLR